MPKTTKKGKHGGARKGAGRKPIGARAMTAAERLRKHRELEKAYAEMAAREAKPLGERYRDKLPPVKR